MIQISTILSVGSVLAVISAIAGFSMYLQKLRSNTDENTKDVKKMSDAIEVIEKQIAPTGLRIENIEKSQKYLDEKISMQLSYISQEFHLSLSHNASEHEQFKESVSKIMEKIDGIHDLISNIRIQITKGQNKNDGKNKI